MAGSLAVKRAAKWAAPKVDHSVAKMADLWVAKRAVLWVVVWVDCLVGYLAVH